MKKLRLVAVLLLTAMLLPLSVSVSAYGVSDDRLIITHINTTNSTEGSAIVLAGTAVQKVGEKGNFAWWSVYIFDWDAEQECFVLTDKNTNSNNVDKSAMEIPENGFAYCICVGNDYSASGGINYITKRIQDSNTYAKGMTEGTKAYLYETNLYAGVVKNNGKNWYADDYASDSYLKIGSPDEGKVAYDPTDESHRVVQFEIKTNYVNDRHYVNGDCILFDASYGSYVKGNGDYGWWRALICDWNPEEGCYTVIGVDTATGNGYGKAPVIPKNGFVLMDCYSSYMSSFDSAKVGAKVYLYKEGSQYRILLNLPDETKTPVTPAGASSIKPAPAIKGISEDGKIKCTPDGYTVKWNAVAGATSYTVSVNKSGVCTLGELVVEPTVVSGTSFALPEGILEVGNAYTVTVSANNSASAMCKLFCFSKEALASKLADKTVLAFGDSLTARSGWVGMLGGFIGTEVINAGVGGDSTNNAIARFENDVLEKDPDVALVCFGMNDQAQKTATGTPNVPLNTYIANLTTIITGLQESGADVILIAPHDAYGADGYYKPGEYGLDYAYGNMKDFCNAVRELAVKYDCGLIDIYAETQSVDMSKFLNAGDGIHQSPEGHTLWAKYVSDYLLAKYDGKNAATITVECKDETGESFTSYTVTAAIGSSLYVPAKKLAGYSTTGEAQLIKVEGDAVVSYNYIRTGMRGDANNDNEINSLDYMMLKRHILGTYTLPEDILSNVDINNNGEIETLDYMILKRVILGTYTLPEA